METRWTNRISHSVERFSDAVSSFRMPPSTSMSSSTFSTDDHEASAAISSYRNGFAKSTWVIALPATLAPTLQDPMSSAPTSLFQGGSASSRGSMSRNARSSSSPQIATCVVRWSHRFLYGSRRALERQILIVATDRDVRVGAIDCFLEIGEGHSPKAFRALRR